VVDAPGDGYVADLQYALDVVPPPVLTVVADLPHLDAAHVDRALSDAVVSDSDSGTDSDLDSGTDSDPDSGADARTVASLTVCVPVELKRTLGVSVDSQFDHAGRAVAPTGLNVVGAGDGAESENVSVVADERLAVNVNRPGDREVAESRCD
jgi:adenosylcobinamide-phosphate guanylyltransferase